MLLSCRGAAGLFCHPLWFHFGRRELGRNSINKRMRTKPNFQHSLQKHLNIYEEGYFPPKKSSKAQWDDASPRGLIIYLPHAVIQHLSNSLQIIQATALDIECSSVSSIKIFPEKFQEVYMV